MRSGVFPVLLTCVALLGSSAAPARTDVPFEGTFDVLLMIIDGSGSANMLSVSDCWEFRKQGEIGPVGDLSQIVRGRILEQTPKSRTHWIESSFEQGSPDWAGSAAT